MAYAITQNCCNDASCVSVCPVNCIHPTPDEPGFGSTELLYVDPKTCIDCGACADACPVDAIFPIDRLLGPDTVYAELNQLYYTEHPTDNAWSVPHFPRSLPADIGAVRVAVIGTGPAACYTAESLLRIGAEVTMLDRQPVPGGLIRFGVAPDHPSTKKIGDSFAGLFQHPRLRMHLNVEVGKDVTHADIAAHHHAVIYAVGAAADKTLPTSTARRSTGTVLRRRADGSSSASCPRRPSCSVSSTSSLSRWAATPSEERLASRQRGSTTYSPHDSSLRSTGYRGRPIPDLPFDPATATVPNHAGRVVDPEQGERVTGTYVVGWIKRGPSGGIGTNRTCAAETVDALLDDANGRELLHPVGSARDFARLVRRRKPHAVGKREVLAIDQAERARGDEAGRPRVKFATAHDLIAAGKGLQRS